MGVRESQVIFAGIFVTHTGVRFTAPEDTPPTDTTQMGTSHCAHYDDDCAEWSILLQTITTGDDDDGIVC